MAEGSDPGAPSPRSAWLLLLGAAAGLLLASAGLLDPTGGGGGGLANDAAATVGERKIRRVDYERVLAGVAGDLRGPVDETVKRRVLDRMIEEELLVQRALELGLPQVDRRIRGELTSSMIESIVVEVGERSPDATDVARHYEENVDFFTRPGRLRARRLYFSKRRDETDPRGSAAERAETARTRLLAGEPIDAVEAALADAQVSPVPDVLLPPAKVRDYVGPGLLEALMALDPGDWSEPIEQARSLSLVAVVDREPAIVPTLAEIESLVRQDLQRRRGDDALRQYLDDLRAATPIEIDETLFGAEREGAGDPAEAGA